MTLADWLTRECMTRRKFAWLAEISPGHVTGLCKDRQPSLSLAWKIEGLTGGEVALSDWMLGIGRQK